MRSNVMYFLLAVWLSVSVVGCNTPAGASGTVVAVTLPATWGALVMSGEIGPDNAPLAPRTTFSQNDSKIYAVLEVQSVAVGTRFHAVWSSQALNFTEESAPVVADQAYQNVHLEFHLEPVPEVGPRLTALQAGDYTVQIFINGSAGPQAAFSIE